MPKENIKMSELNRSIRNEATKEFDSDGNEEEEKSLTRYSDFEREQGSRRKNKSSSKSHHSSSCLILPYRWKIRIKAILVLCLLGIPGNFVTVALLIVPPTHQESNSSIHQIANKTHRIKPEEDITFCHEKLKDVLPILDKSLYWIEGVSLAIVGTIGLIGNTLTLLVLGLYETKSSFNALLMSLVTMDTVLVVFYLFDSAYIAAFKNEEPEWYKYIFPYFWHPLRNICSSACIYMVVAVATERHHAICHPMRYKPSPLFYLSIVGGLSFLVNISKFFEFELQYREFNSTVEYWTTILNEDARYVVFNSYYECVVSGIFPLVALCILNFRIYSKIRKSSRMKHRYVGGRSISSTRTLQSASASIMSRRNIKRNDSHQGSIKSRSTVRLLSVNYHHRHPSNSSHTKEQASGSSINDSSSLIEFAPTSSTHSSTRLKRSCSTEKSSSMPQAQMTSNHKHFQSRKEKSTGILICIILVFIACHIIKLGIQMYEIFSPTHGLVDHFNQCRDEGRLHVPAIFHILGNLNHLCLVFNSSVNFLIYCCMAKKFRSVLEKLLFRKYPRSKSRVPGAT